MASTIILSLAVCILFEVVAVLAYAIYKVKKELKEIKQELEETATSVDNLAECVLKLSNSIPRIEIIEPDNIKSTDFTFPNSDGI